MGKTIPVQEKHVINPGLAAVLSFLYNGLGQLYNGDIRKGLTIISCSSIGLIFTITGAIWTVRHFLENQAFPLGLEWGLSLFIIGILIIGVAGTYSISDAYNSARRKLLGQENRSC